jgi:hypothetical protein
MRFRKFLTSTQIINVMSRLLVITDFLNTNLTGRPIAGVPRTVRYVSSFAITSIMTASLLSGLLFSSQHHRPAKHFWTARPTGFRGAQRVELSKHVILQTHDDRCAPLWRTLFYLFRDIPT